MSRLNAKVIVTISALPTLLLAKSAILHAWALDMNQRQCLYARCEGGAEDEENDKAIGVYEFLFLDYLAVVLLDSSAYDSEFQH